eukprot:CAMPEP_0168315726 /NCGR_PEP_ID=MMETSP0210-20121227/12504_1 /TAXON_ID=40633 /ORGANISM="Condylostoma magnum, Strain COL2" /LENGTH=38 /DNA_ID= /DNA_START= /DNA_END= /DNA_ORIENTATION=
MLLAAIYLAMLVTNWGDANIGGGNYKNSDASLWIKLSA